MIKRIDIGGIERQLSVSNMADGSMYGMVGARHLDGNIRPAQGLEALSDVSLSEGDRLLYVHRYGDYEHYIVWKANMDLCYVTAGKEELIEQEVRYIGKVVSIGHSLIVTGSETSFGIKSTRTWLWKETSYKEQKRSELPLLIFSRGEYGSLGVTETMTLKYEKSYYGSIGTFVTEESVRRELTDTYSTLRGMMQEKAWGMNLFCDAMLVRYGLRLYDGSYIAVSPPILMEPRRLYDYKAGVTLDAGYIGKEMRTYIEGYGYSLGYRIDESVKSIDAEMCPYIDILVSAPILQDDLANQKVKSYSITPTLNGSGDYTLTYDVSQKGIDIEEHYVYYRVESLEVSSLQKAVEKLGYKEETLKVGGKMSYLRQLPILERVNNPVFFEAQSAIVYNNRLHMGDITEYIVSKYNLGHYSYSDPDEGSNGYYKRPYQIVIVYYDIDGEEKKSIGRYTNVIEGSNLSKIIGIPDARAKRIVIAWPNMKIDVSLKEHSMENLSYYYNKDGIPTISITANEYNQLVQMVEDNKVVRREVLKVSELNNPLVWPNDKTYTVGSGNIVSMAVATKAMSQGQFGQYPLYVFTSEGIYAMLSGGGDVLYSNVAPVNRHIVENAKTVCSLDDAVVFGTRQGLFVMSGGDAVCISGPLDDHGVKRNSRGVETVVLASIFGAPPLTEFVTMRELISQGCVSYDYANEEILLYNPGQILCYAYSLKNKMWQSYSRNIRYTVDNYPELCVVTGKGVMKTMNEDGEVVPEFLLVTNGMQLSDSLHSKRILRMHLLSHFGGDGDGGTVVVSVACSNDGEEYVLTYKREYKEVRSLHHITLPHSASGYRYISLIIYGKNLNKLTYINGIEVEYEDSRKER